MSLFLALSLAWCYLAGLLATWSTFVAGRKPSPASPFRDPWRALGAWAVLLAWPVSVPAAVVLARRRS